MIAKIFIEALFCLFVIHTQLVSVIFLLIRIRLRVALSDPVWPVGLRWVLMKILQHMLIFYAGTHTKCVYYTIYHVV